MEGDKGVQRWWKTKENLNKQTTSAESKQSFPFIMNVMSYDIELMNEIINVFLLALLIQ